MDSYIWKEAQKNPPSLSCSLRSYVCLNILVNGLDSLMWLRLVHGRIWPWPWLCNGEQALVWVMISSTELPSLKLCLFLLSHNLSWNFHLTMVFIILRSLKCHSLACDKSSTRWLWLERDEPNNSKLLVWEFHQSWLWWWCWKMEHDKFVKRDV